MIAVYEKEERVISDIRNYGPEVQVVVGKCSRYMPREIVNNSCLTLGFHNGVLKVLPPIWEFPKMTLKQLIKNCYVGNQRENVPPL